MAPRSRILYLHIGLPKTGTTTLQAILWRNREALAQHGVRYPGPDPGAHHHAVIDLHGGRYAQWQDRVTEGGWDRLVDAVRAGDSASLVSTELLAPASPQEAAEALAPFGSFEVHIVCTARDLVRQIPSVWQENIKTRHTTGFADFLAAIRADPLEFTGRLFWDFQDLPRVLRTWSQNMPPDRVHVVTVPHGGSAAVLWDRFATVLGLDPAGFDRDLPTANPSLGFTETELLRRLNLALPDELQWSDYAHTVQHQLAVDIIPDLDLESRHIPFPAGAYQWACDSTRHVIHQIKTAGYRVVGDLDDLLPAATSGQAVTPPTNEELLSAAVATLAELVQRKPRP